MTKNKTAAKKTEDQSVVYKVPAAFVLMIVVIYAFWKLGGYYSTVEGFTALYPMFCVQRYVFLALTAAELVLCVLLKNGLARTICRYWLAAFALLFVSSLYKIMDGTVQPQRNTLLRLALTLDMDFEQCQQLLKAGSVAQLTSSRLRDRIIMIGLLNQEPLDEISRTLDEQGFVDLYAKC